MSSIYNWVLAVCLQRFILVNLLPEEKETQRKPAFSLTQDR